MSITLYPIFDQKEIEETRDLDSSLVNRVRKMFETTSLADGLTITLRHASDSQGSEFYDMAILVSSRWTVAGNVWLSGDGFKVNATDLVNRIQKIVDGEGNC